MRRSSPASCAGATGASRDVELGLVERRGELAQHPVRDELAPLAGRRAPRRRPRNTPASLAARGERARRRRPASAYCASKRACIASGQLRQRRRARARSTPRRSRAAAGRGRGSSGSPARLPCCASSASRRGRGRRAASPGRRVPPSSISSIWRRTSKSIACCMKRKQLRFLISQRVPSFVVARGPHRDVGVAAEAAFLHVAVADADPAHQRVQRLRVGDRLVGAAHVGLGDDLEQRRAGAVEVDAGHAVEVLVQRLAGVLLEVRAREPHDLLALRRRDGRAMPPCTTGISYWLIW